MSTKTKTLAKSLHTVTALVAVARLLKHQSPEIADVEHLCAAVNALGYNGAADPYNLKGKALEILRKG